VTGARRAPAGGPDGPPQASRRVPRDPRRLLLAGAGLVSVGLAAAGAVLPGLPTTIFLIIASYCFARSCPWLEERLLRRAIFAPYMRVLEGRQPMAPRARLAAVAMMWLSVGLSLWMLGANDRLPAWMAAAILTAGLAGTVAIARFRTT